jgi:hypothetical protein
MEFLEILADVLAVVETVALLFFLVFVTKAMKEKKASKGTDDASIKRYYSFSAIAFGIYIVLNVIRNQGILG